MKSFLPAFRSCMIAYASPAVTAGVRFADPVRYANAGKKDFILMLGGHLKGDDVPHQLVEPESTRIRGAHCAATRYQLTANSSPPRCLGRNCL